LVELIRVDMSFFFLDFFLKFYHLILNYWSLSFVIFFVFLGYLGSELVKLTQMSSILFLSIGLFLLGPFEILFFLSQSHIAG
jgi:hypothetical protein